MTLPLLVSLAACLPGDVYIVEGTVVEVNGPTEVVIDHQDIAGLMSAMVMPFPVADPTLLDGVAPGDKVIARYQLAEGQGKLIRIRVVGHGPAPRVAMGPAPVRVGETMPPVSVPLHDGTTIQLGPGQTERVALTWVYTRCPQPEFCPAMITRLQALQQALGEAPGARIVAVTLDPVYDTREVLAAHATQVGAGPGWSFARVEPEALADLAMRGGLPVMDQSGEIAHGLRLLVIDRGGKLIERYDDARFPIERVVMQLTTGAPPGDPNNSGTVSP